MPLTWKFLDCLVAEDDDEGTRELMLHEGRHGTAESVGKRNVEIRIDY